MKVIEYFDRHYLREIDRMPHLIDMDFESYSMAPGDNSLLYYLIKDNNLEEIKLLLENGTDVNAPILTTGPLAGCTALHMAAVESNVELAILLVEEYKADVNLKADDGTEPIHLACLFHQPTSIHRPPVPNVVEIYLEFKANANAELRKEIFLKYAKDNQKWYPDFGDAMSLITYTVLYDKEDLTYLLERFGANTGVVSLANKTLLMYALDKDLHYTAATITVSMKDPKLLNHRDNDGRSAIHYLLHPKKYGEFRYDANQQFGKWVTNILISFRHIFEQGGDIYALVNNDPATFLPNMAAYRSCDIILRHILPYYRSMSQSRALYYATLPVDENSPTYLRVPEEFNPDIDPVAQLPKLRRLCTTLILKDLINRHTFGLSVPDEENKLMKKLMATDRDVRNIVENYLADFINGELKNEVVEFGDKKMSRYDFIMEVWNDRKLKLLVRDENLVFQSYRWSAESNPDYYYFVEPVADRIEISRRRYYNFEELKMVRQLKDAIPLPYELILEIVEFLSNDDLSNFLQAFWHYPY